jgi:phosphatidylglycerol:prolipoprotein diacylglycerol transferase
MFPYFKIFGRIIGLYSILSLCGIFSSGVYACIMTNKRKYDYSEIIIFGLFLYLGALIGGQLLYSFVNYKNIINVFINIDKIDSIKTFLNAFNYIFGGLVYYGSLIGAIIVGSILIKKDSKYKKYIDIVAVNIPLFHFFGRIGCFLGGCCYGIPSKIGFIYTNNPIIKANGIKRFPVQLLEAFFNIALFFLLNYFYKNKKYENKLLYIYLIIYPIGRFFIEFLRGDEYRGIWSIFSTSQIISCLIIIIVLFRQKYTSYQSG